jgi:hypothetical protein
MRRYYMDFYEFIHELKKELNIPILSDENVDKLRDLYFNVYDVGYSDGYGCMKVEELEDEE